MARMTGSRLIHIAGCVGCTIGLAGLVTTTGCGKGDRWWKKNEPRVTDDQSGNAGGANGDANSEVDTSLTALARDDESLTVPEGTIEEDFGSTHDRVAESARMMDEYFAGMDAGEDPVQAVVVEEPTIESGSDDWGGDNGGDDGSFSLSSAAAELANDTVTGTESGSDSESGASVDVAMVESSESGVPDSEITDDAETPVEVNAEQRVAELVSELVGVLTELARTSENPGSAAAALAGMDSMSVELLEGLRDEGVLSETELSTLRAARSVLDSISSSGEIASPDAVADVLARVKDDLDRASGIRVVRALLCTRVDGFGRYEPFESNEFVAGRMQEVIVYVEVDRFGHRELTGNDGQPRYEVELSQRLELYHVADDLNTWNRAADVDRSVSRNKVRDYYLINKITLPSNLGVGRYHLKVVMRDLVDEKVGEIIIPIRMVVR